MLTDKEKETLMALECREAMKRLIHALGEKKITPEHYAECWAFWCDTHPSKALLDQVVDVFEVDE